MDLTTPRVDGEKTRPSRAKKRATRIEKERLNARRTDRRGRPITSARQMNEVYGHKKHLRTKKQMGARIDLQAFERDGGTREPLVWRGLAIRKAYDAYVAKAMKRRAKGGGKAAPLRFHAWLRVNFKKHYEAHIRDFAVLLEATQGALNSSRRSGSGSWQRYEPYDNASPRIHDAPAAGCGLWRFHFLPIESRGGVGPHRIIVELPGSQGAKGPSAWDVRRAWYWSKQGALEPVDLQR